MKRRDFLIKSIPAAAILPAIVDNYSVKAFNSNSPLLQALMAPGIDTDHVLVIVQLSGGNDGLNTVIPISNYSAYYNARTNIAIPENKILSLTGVPQTGLHPGMTGMQSMFNDGKLAILQAVGYPNPNFSHFRATDIWMSGSDSNVELTSGWAGRYLNTEYPNFPVGYPNSSMTDPLAIQIGSITSLTLQGPSISMGMSITNPTSFYNLINNVQDPVPDTPAGNELTYIRTVASQTNAYAQRVKDAANAVTQQSTYPTNNPLADQLKIVARLVKGGLKTRIYMVSYGSFDNHSLQVNASDTTTGTHAKLLTTVSDAIKAFTDDCNFLGIGSRVIGMTFSEFGRRIKSNSSVGTDHGAAAPMFLFGQGVVPGLYGTNPLIPANITVNDNIPFQYDFRSVYASVLANWFCVPADTLQTVLMKNFQTLNIVNNSSCTGSNPNPSGDNLISNYPNPFTGSTLLKFTTKGGHTLIQVIDMTGRVIATPVDRDYPSAGTFTQSFDGEGLPNGVYYARLQNGATQQVKAMLKVR
ncbi:MAG: DUF1501 domain-containing protein [Bacteroidetes bacterium]|nr:DUF1501 domain-containing protein [Bacteroidota bacterium]MBS1931373.1 DUF1501 domain-containing protein [Bacteroidota bacterium]